MLSFIVLNELVVPVVVVVEKVAGSTKQREAVAKFGKIGCVPAWPGLCLGQHGKNYDWLSTP